MLVSKTPASFNIVVSLSEDEALSLVHRLNVGRNRLMNAPASFKNGKVKPGAMTYGEDYGVTADMLAADGKLQELADSLTKLL